MAPEGYTYTIIICRVQRGAKYNDIVTLLKLSVGWALPLYRFIIGSLSN